MPPEAKPVRHGHKCRPRYRRRHRAGSIPERSCRPCRNLQRFRSFPKFAEDDALSSAELPETARESSRCFRQTSVIACWGNFDVPGIEPENCHAESEPVRLRAIPRSRAEGFQPGSGHLELASISTPCDHVLSYANPTHDIQNETKCRNLWIHVGDAVGFSPNGHPYPDRSVRIEPDGGSPVIWRGSKKMQAIGTIGKIVKI